MDDHKDEQLNKDEHKEENCEQCQEYLDGWKRAKADLMNYQKDEQKRFQEFAKYSLENAMRDLIAVLDSLERAVAATSPVRDGESSQPDSSSNGMEKGIHLIKNQFEDSLKRHGLEKIQVSPGDQFDPAMHESLGEMDSDQESGTIAVEVESGYTLNGKVVRPTRVKLAKQAQ